jgi:hypothetical protein
MKLILITLSILVVLVIISPNATLASFRAPDVDLPDRGAIPNNSGVYQGTSFIDTVELIINWILTFVGIFIFGIFLYAGFEYATSGGNDDKAKEARSRMANAIIGLLILFFAFVASNAVLSFVFQTNNNGNTNVNNNNSNNQTN